MIEGVHIFFSRTYNIPLEFDENVDYLGQNLALTKLSPTKWV
jgi:hypothetical protein